MAANKGIKMQREMSFFMELPAPKLVDDHLIAMCKNRLDAIRLCAQLSSMSHEMIAESLGIDKGHWSRMMQGRANFPDAKSVEFMRLCGNLAPMQYEAKATGYELVKSAAEKRVQELERELMAAKAALAA